MPSPFPCSPVICECSWKKTHIEKQKTKKKHTHTPTYQYTNPVSKHAIVRKPVLSTSHVNTSAPAVVTLNSS